VADLCLTLVYTDRSGPEGVTRRIISARRSNQRERQAYEEACRGSRRGRADLARVRAMSEDEVRDTSPPELADIPEDFWDEAEMIEPQTKEAISLRVDQDVLEWFRSAGPRYQSRMNTVLRSYMTAVERRRRAVSRKNSEDNTH
jgi:uncharacterized protein (DUF4415 family)